MLVHYLSACLAIGNLVIEEGARDTFLGIAMSVRALSEQLKSRDRYVCPYTPTYLSSYCYTCVRILLYMCPHTAIYVSSYCYICVLILCYICDRFLVRYATGAIRNVAVDGKVLSLLALLVLH
jgi:hypothetical protein